MRRALVTLLALASVGIAASSTFAGRPAPMSWLQTNILNPQPVEQWGDIDNPTPCAWDPDDVIEGRFHGTLDGGQTVTGSVCVVLDHIAHLVAIEAVAPFVASVQVAGVSGGCIYTPTYDANEPLPAVGDGFGVITEVRYSVTNTARHRVTSKVPLPTTLRLPTDQSAANWGCPWPP